jgi:hypothetical protein
MTLYRARGNQIEEYGYAAFGLTIALFAFMSLINIISNLLTLLYLSIYLIANDQIEEARNDEGSVDGVVRCIDSQKMLSNSADMSSLPWLGSLLVYSWPICLVSLAIVGGLSGFHSGNSTKAQRGWTTSRLVNSTVYSQWGGLVGSAYNEENIKAIGMALFMGIVPAIRAFVAVGQMLKSYGGCIRIN